MADNIIKVNVTANKSQRVTVSSANVGTEITASSDTGKFWAQNAKNWAVSENIVDGEDYSSKYYANKSKGYAQNAESFEGAARETYDNFINLSNETTETITGLKQTSITEIEDIKSSSVVDINATVNAGIAEINTTKTTILNDIEFVADGEKEEIRDLADLIKENAEEIASRTSFAMFDTVHKDHILTYEETKGLALQGTYVYKEAIAGSRYGYADFYAKVLEEKEGATATEVTLGSSTITMYVATNGHQYYDIANKDVVDAFYSATGSAWFYGVDTENKRVFLPRRNKKRYLLDSKKPTSSDRSWYNIYSDGWCEQGGINYGTGAWGSTTVTLPISYLDAHYTLTIGSTAVSEGDYTSASGSTNRGTSLGNIFNKTKNSFVVQSITNISWETKGYMA